MHHHHHHMDGECTGLKACFVIIILLHCTLGIVSLWQVFSVSVVDYASKLQATSQQYGKCKGAPPDFKGGTPTYSSMGGIVRKGALGETVNLSKTLQDQWLAKKRFTDVMKEDSENTLTEKAKGSKWEPFLVLNEARGNKRNPSDASGIRVVEPFPTEGFTFNAAAKDEFLLAYRPLNLKNLNILVDFYEDETEDEETISRKLANTTESFWNNQARRLSRIIVKDAKTKAEEKVAERKAAREQLKAQRAASKKARARRHQKSQAQQVIQGRPGFQCRSLVGEKYLHAVYANARPFGRLCFLLLPFYGRDRPQVADGSALAVALHFMGALAARGGGGGMRMGFNSLGACASVNHLHFQGWQFDDVLPLETAARVPVGPLALDAALLPPLLAGRPGGNAAAAGAGAGAGDVNGTAGLAPPVFELSRYPIQGLVFEVGDLLKNNGVVALGDALGRCMAWLQKEDIPHTMVLNNREVYLLLRQHQKDLPAALAAAPAAPGEGGGDGAPPPGRGGLCPGFPEMAGEIVFTSGAHLERFRGPGGADALHALLREGVSAPRAALERLVAGGCLGAPAAAAGEEGGRRRRGR